MNGLEAIELMKQGKIVIKKSNDCLFKIEGDKLYYRFIWESKWSFCTVLNINEFYEEYIEPKQLTGWERVENEDNYFRINSFGDFFEFREMDVNSDKALFESANYFSTKEKAEEINFKQTLFRKLQRFSDENGGTEIDWNDEDQTKFSIKYSHWSSKLSIDCYNTVQQFGQVYFASKEVARKAIELFHDDLIKYFTM